jgi:excinuclease UvrABC nuclease subunit
MSNQTCRWNGVELHILAKDANWSKSAGIYIFAGVNSNRNWVALYIGQASSFADRVPNHERWDDAVKRGATHVHACIVPTQAERDRLEESLVRAFQPPLNVHYVSGGVR